MAKKEIVWNDFDGGISENPFEGPKGSYADAKGVMTDINLSALPDERGNYIFFGYGWTDISPVALEKNSGEPITGMVHTGEGGVNAAGAVVYFYQEEEGHLLRKNDSQRSGTIVTSVNDLDTTKNRGLAFYQNGVFYANRDNIGRKDINAGVVDDWMSTVPTNGALQSNSNSHPMHVHKDETLYIGDENFINALVDTTYENQALALPSDYSVVAMASYGNDLAIATNGFKSSAFTDRKLNRDARTVPPRVFFWNTSDADFYNSVEVNVPAIQTIIYAESQLLVFGNGGQVLAWDGRGFRQVARLPDQEFPIHGQHGVAPFRSGVLVACQTRVIYINLRGGISVHAYYKMPSFTTTHGAIAVARDGLGDNTNVYLATDGGLYQFNSTNTAESGSYIQSLYYTKPKNFDIIAVEVYHIGGTVGGGDVDVKIVDVAGTETTVGTINNTNHSGKTRVYFDGMTVGSAGAMPKNLVGGFAIKLEAGSAFVMSNYPAIKQVRVIFEEYESYS